MLRLNLLSPQVSATTMGVQSQVAASDFVPPQPQDSFQMAPRPNFFQSMSAAIPMSPLAFGGGGAFAPENGFVSAQTGGLIAVSAAIFVSGLIINSTEKQNARARLTRLAEPLDNLDDEFSYDVSIAQIGSSQPYIYWSAKHRRWYAETEADINKRIEDKRQFYLKANDELYGEVGNAMEGYLVRASALREEFGNLIPLTSQPEFILKGANGNYVLARKPYGAESLEQLLRENKDMRKLKSRYEAKYSWANAYLEALRVSRSLSRFVNIIVEKGTAEQQGYPELFRNIREFEDEMKQLGLLLREKLVGGLDPFSFESTAKSQIEMMKEKAAQLVTQGLRLENDW